MSGKLIISIQRIGSIIQDVVLETIRASNGFLFNVLNIEC